MTKFAATIGLFLCACGGVADDSPDARVIDGHQGPDARACDVDGFDGSTLAPHWALLTGTLPTYDVSGSRVLITDAAFAPTPSVSDNRTWIYDLDFDKGNQIAWPHAFGGSDFSIEADIGWSSSAPELTMGGVAVTDAQGKIAALIGFEDPGGGLAPPEVRIRASGNDLIFNGVDAEVGSAVFRMERTSGMLRMFIGGEEVLTGPSSDLISNVTIYAVRHRNGATEYPFGSVEVRSLSICGP